MHKWNATRLAGSALVALALATGCSSDSALTAVGDKVFVGYNDGDYDEVFIRRVVDLDDKRAVVNLTLRR
mgnify:CR=1 FL=1